MATITKQFKLTVRPVGSANDSVITLNDPIQNIDSDVLAAKKSAFTSVGYTLKSGYYYTVTKGEVTPVE